MGLLPCCSRILFLCSYLCVWSFPWSVDLVSWSLGDNWGQRGVGSVVLFMGSFSRVFWFWVVSRKVVEGL